MGQLASFGPPLGQPKFMNLTPLSRRKPMLLKHLMSEHSGIGYEQFSDTAGLGPPCRVIQRRRLVLFMENH
jgi:hypothetical protein